jgi:hypothetical protein
LAAVGLGGFGISGGPNRTLGKRPFRTIKEVNKVASDAERDFGWIVLPFSTQMR